MNTHRTIAALAACLAIGTMGSAGCASMTHSFRQDVAIDSDPPGARVFINDKHVGVTPVSVNLSRHSRHTTICVAKEGFVTEVVPLKRSLSNWIAADVALSLDPMAIQGMDSMSQYPRFVASMLALTIGVDLATGAAFTFPKLVRVTLAQEPSPPSAASGGVATCERRK